MVKTHMENIMNFVQNELKYVIIDISDKLTLSTYSYYVNMTKNNNIVLICQMNKKNQDLFQVLSLYCNTLLDNKNMFYICYKHDFVLMYGFNKDKIDGLFKRTILHQCNGCLALVEDGYMLRSCACGYAVCLQCMVLRKKDNLLICSGCNVRILY